jgi:hypothetical protein
LPKGHHDPQEYDADRLIMLWRKRERTLGLDPLPRPEPLPGVYIDERIQWFNG